MVVEQDQQLEVLTGLLMQQMKLPNYKVRTVRTFPHRVPLPPPHSDTLSRTHIHSLSLSQTLSLSLSLR